MEEPAPKKAKVSPEPAPEKAKATVQSSSPITTNEFAGNDYIGSDYTGLVITCIRVKSNAEDNIVEFTETDGCGDEAIFLTSLTEIKGRCSVRRFRAMRLTVDEAKELIKNPPKPPGVSISDESWKNAFRDAIPLFCLHGFNVEPSELFDLMEKRNRYSNKEKHVQEVFAEQQNGGKYYPVLMLWPSSIFGLVTYKVEREKNDLQAQKVFRFFADTISRAAFPRKSLMMHSMGNYLVLNGACSGSSPPLIAFDDIFMVAADVDYDAFHHQPDEIVNGIEKTLRARNFFSMLRTEAVAEEEIANSDSSNDDSTITTTNSEHNQPKPVGKVHILHNVDDVSLLLSTTHDYFNSTTPYCINKLGQRGNGMYISVTAGSNSTEWRADRRDEMALFPNSYVNVDCSSQVMYSSKMKHDYQFDEFAIAYYANASQTRATERRSESEVK